MQRVPTSGAGPFKAVATAAVATAAELGPLRIAVNCTGPGPAHRTVSKEGPYSLDMFNRIVQVNLIGTFNVSRLAAAEMAKTEEIDGERGGQRVPHAAVAVCADACTTRKGRRYGTILVDADARCPVDSAARPGRVGGLTTTPGVSVKAEQAQFGPCWSSEGGRALACTCAMSRSAVR
ncbi:hypothetical protein ACFRCI_34385 [Streptomyces sp. NPDC056638]|uniref:hypothetical protein n=1 Tax=Streptomyces sp. NPDC056638 TaxID=3345887 RepID=UPI0036BAC4F4